ncbi:MULTISPECIES: hypothetical protein [Microbacterium]|uniref:hypothetical protein n=1 Tax=Microbacterium TaxID=33882 RepID=UPI00034E0A45|nr:MULTISPECIES: hypothetical protein [Microbacterium]EPD84224.1 hypothetical protein HMPREF1529_02289 [Microbacterium sp. oral taxon 186 str. F0373]
MANPFLVLGGVAVGVVTAGIGVLQVPGWIDSANDSAATNDLAQISLSEEAANTQVGRYIPQANLISGEYGTPAVKTGVKIQQSSGVVSAVALNAAGDRWAAITVSKSGNVFVRTSDSTTVIKSTSKLSAAIANSAFSGLPTGVTLGGTITAPTITLS